MYVRKRKPSALAFYTLKGSGSSSDNAVYIAVSSGIQNVALEITYAPTKSYLRRRHSHGFLSMRAVVTDVNNTACHTSGVLSWS